MFRVLCLLLFATGAAAESAYQCETTAINSPEFPQHKAALLVQDGALVLSNGERISEMKLIARNPLFEIYDAPPYAIAVLHRGKNNASLQIIQPKSGTAPRLIAYLCKQE